MSEKKLISEKNAELLLASYERRIAKLEKSRDDVKMYLQQRAKLKEQNERIIADKQEYKEEREISSAVGIQKFILEHQHLFSQTNLVSKEVLEALKEYHPDTTFTIRTVQKSLKALVEKGELYIRHSGRFQPTIYSFTPVLEDKKINTQEKDTEDIAISNAIRLMSEKIHPNHQSSFGVFGTVKKATSRFLGKN